MQSIYKLLLVIAAIIIFFILCTYFCIKYYRKGRAELFFVYPIIIVLVLGALSFLFYNLIKESIYNYKHNSFTVEIGDTLDNIDFEKLYDEIYEKSRAESELLANATKNINFEIVCYLDSDGKIMDLNIYFAVPKHGQFYWYESYYKEGKLYFEYCKSCKLGNAEDYQGKFLYLSVYFKRLNTMDYTIFTDYLKDNDFNQGMKVYLDFDYSETARNKIVEDSYF